MMKKQGITVSVLVITIIVLTILAGAITVSTLSTVNYSKLSSWVSEISYIQEVVEEQNNVSSNMDYTMQQIELSISSNVSDEQFEGEDISEDNKLILKTLDLGKLKITNTVYGNLDTTTDVYAISEKTGRVYYVQGIEIDGQMYYSLTDSLRQRFNLISPEGSLSSIVFAPNVVGYSNKPITVVVKVPKTYTDIVITTSNAEIQIGAQTEKETTYEYAVNTNEAVGNYTITVTYNNGTQSLTSKYEVNSYDVTKPVITPLDYYSWSYKELETETIDYITNVTATDASGIRIMKYALGTISLNDAQTYFKDNGNIIANGKINLDRNITTYTIYAEDNAGNFAILTFDKKDIMPEDWKENVSYVHNTVPIPKGFVVSPYKDEISKNGGIVIYELAENETEIPSTETQFESWTERNQYVWIPVDDFTKFVRKDYINETSKVVDTDGNYTALGTSIYWEVMVDENNLPLTTIEEQGSSYMSATTLAEVQAMYASVKEYGGFYIARYEAGIDLQRTSSTEALITGKSVHSKMGKIPYNNITWSTSSTMNVDTGAAVEVARGLYPNDSANTTGVISTLVYGVQWDTTVQWYIDTGAMTLAEANKTTGSTAFGNHSDRVINSADELNEEALVWDYSASSSGSYVAKDSETLTYPKVSGTKWALSTGALKAANINNIYDMAGNMTEWTMGGNSTGKRVVRAGEFYESGASLPISNRYVREPVYNNVCYGFRPTLYIKK